MAEIVLRSEERSATVAEYSRKVIGLRKMAVHTAVYPGMFDPVTNGHLDLIERGVRIFDRLIVAVVTNPSKNPLFSIEERLDMLREAVQGIPNVELDAYDGLVVDYVREKKAQVILRGLRAVSDFEYEFEMALTNRSMAETVETVFLAPSLEYIYLRARVVKELAHFGGDVSPYVPAAVETRLKEKFASLNELKIEPYHPERYRG